MGAGLACCVLKADLSVAGTYSCFLLSLGVRIACKLSLLQHHAARLSLMPSWATVEREALSGS